MLFSEYYGEYYACVSEILSEAVEGTLTKERISGIASKQGFGESMLTIPANLKNGNWPLITPDCKTRIRRIPAHPVTLLQKRWLKAVLADPRAGLFLEDAHRAALNDALADTEPLFRYEDFYYFDQFSDGDDYADAAYRRHFRTILQAIRNDRMIRVRYEARTGRTTRLFL